MKKEILSAYILLLFLSVFPQQNLYPMFGLFKKEDHTKLKADVSKMIDLFHQNIRHAKVICSSFEDDMKDHEKFYNALTYLGHYTEKLSDTEGYLSTRFKRALEYFLEIRAVIAHPKLINKKYPWLIDMIKEKIAELEEIEKKEESVGKVMPLSKWIFEGVEDGIIILSPKEYF